MSLFDMAVTLALSVLLAVIAVIDWRSLRIPDRLSLPLIGAGLVLAAVGPRLGDHLIGAVLGYALLAGFGAAFYRFRGVEGLGLGDAKLFAAAGAWLGWQGLPAVLLVAALGGLAFALATGQARRDRTIAFGPWLALGFWLVWLVWLVRGG